MFAELEMQGMKQGMKEGLKQGALRMKQKGYPLEDIADITGLSVDEIAAL